MNNTDPINPKHYQGTVECIEIIKQLGNLKGFCIGNCIKYLWRADAKHPKPLEDLKKAKWYLDYYINYLENNNNE